jgi:uncharacterized protein
MKTIAIYHKDCTDGTSAAAVVLRAYPDAMLFPLGHGHEAHEIEEIVKQAAPGDRILTVDCVIGVKELLAAGHSVTSLDHHAGVEAEMRELAASDPRFVFIFDNSKSGASLAWSHFFPNEEVPELIKLVEDLDLWKWKYSPVTEQVTGRAWMFENDPKKMLEVMQGPLDQIKKEGAVIAEYKKKSIERALDSLEPVTMRIGEWNIPLFNSTLFKSEIGNILSLKHGGAVGIYSIKGDHLTVSFRSTDVHTPSALDIAKAVGGSGHRNAAGARIALPVFAKSIGL